MRKPILGLLLAPLTLLGCLDSENVVVNMSPEDLVIANSHVVQDAAEAFAAENNGEYPMDFSHQSLAGRTLMDLLPNGTYLTNPFTQTANVPIDLAAVFSGETGYRPYLETPSGPATGYVINGFGGTAEIISLQSGVPDSILAAESQVIADCYTVRDAAEAFAAENNGLYPVDVSIDTTPAGNTLVDFLPAGALLENAFTALPCCPLEGPAASYGETGYAVLLGQGGVATGYYISGWGKEVMIIETSNDRSALGR